jgi:hypothetical protein
MPARPDDPFNTMRLTVPNLVELVSRLRDRSLRTPVTVIHCIQDGESEWVLSTAAARLARDNIRTLGPEPIKPIDLVEHAVRVGAKVAFVGELRREEDARAARAAAALDIHPVGAITAPTREEAEALLTILGPWKGYDVALLSSAGQ